MKIRLFSVFVVFVYYSISNFGSVGADNVKPVWRTPISEPNPVDSQNDKEKEHSNLSKRAQPNYYTRPEQVSIPDYRAPKQRLPNQVQHPQPNHYPQQPPFFNPAGFPYPPPSKNGPIASNPFYPNQPGHFRPFAWVGPQPGPGSPQTNYYEQVPNKGQSFNNGLPPLPNNWQQYPMQMIWIPDVSSESTIKNNGANNVNNYPSYSNPNPYSSVAGGPVPPVQYGVYGPAQSTKAPMKPAVNPEGYTGTVIHSPSANPTTPIASTEPTSSNPHGGGGPTTSLYGGGGQTTNNEPSGPTISSTYPSSSVDYSTQPNESVTIPTDSKSTPEIESSPSSFPTSSFSPPSTGISPNHNPTIRPGPQEPSETTKTVLPYDADGTRDLETTTRPESKIPLFKMTENPFEEPSGKTVPPVYLGSEEENNDDTEDITTTSAEREKGKNGLSSTPTPAEEENEMMKNFFPRPVSPQGYQPPGHQPEDFSSHINVNFKKPKGCIPPFCRGVDVDKISLYKPDRDHEGVGPTLVISNSAKDDANRAGYKPAASPINPYVPPPPPTHPEEYATPFTNSPEKYPFPPFKEYSGVPYIPTQPPTQSQNTSPPRSLIPAHNFPPPSEVPPSNEDFFETTPVTFIPTAQTISTRFTPSTEAPTTQSTSRSKSGKEKEFEEKPEYVPPAIIHMTASTPIGKSPPTYKPLHPDQTSVPPTETTERVESQTPATITRQPGFPSKTNSAPTGGTTTLSKVGKEFETTPTPVQAGGNNPHTTTTTEVQLSTITPVTITKTETDRITETTGRSSEQSTPSTSGRSSEEYTSSTTPSSQFETTLTQSSLPFVPTEHPTSETQIFTDRESTASFSTLTTDIVPPSTTSETPKSSAEWIYTTSTFSPITTEVTADIFSPSSPPEVSHPVSQPTSTPPRQPPRNNPYAPPEGAPRVPNRLIGKPKIVCKEDGISFEVKTILPLTGEVFANDRKRIPECQRSFTDETHPKVFLPFSTCGVKNIGDQLDSRAQYHMQVILIIDQGNGTNSLQSFMAQCIHQKVNYNKQILPKRIEEALEELRLIPSKLEQKASMPTVQMQIVVDEGHHKLGPEVSAADIGMPLALRWNLVPESDAYGMHVRNCKVVDAVGKMEHFLIDEQGCSADLQIIDHPHYDTYHDTASAHMWAFKIPDMASLQIKCDILICSNIKSSITNTTSCEDIPSPPFCVDLITSPPNSILSDASSFIKTRRSSAISATETAATQSVRTSICLSKNCRPQFTEDVRVCINTQLATTSTGLSIAFLLFAISFQIIARTKAKY